MHSLAVHRFWGMKKRRREIGRREAQKGKNVRREKEILKDFFRVSFDLQLLI